MRRHASRFLVAGVAAAALLTTLGRTSWASHALLGSTQAGGAAAVAQSGSARAAAGAAKPRATAPMARAIDPARAAAIADAEAKYRAVLDQYEEIARTRPIYGNKYMRGPRVDRVQWSVSTKLLDAALALIRARGGDAKIYDTALYGRILEVNENAGSMLGPMARRNAEKFDTYTAFAPAYLLSNGFAGVFAEKKYLFMSAAGILRMDGTTLHEIKHMQDNQLLADGRITPAHGTLVSTGMDSMYGRIPRGYGRRYDFTEPHAFIRGSLGHGVAELRRLGESSPEAAAVRADMKETSERVRGFLNHRLEVTRDFKNHVENDGDVAWRGGGEGKPPPIASTDFRKHGARYELPVSGGKAPSYNAENREEEVAAFRARTLTSLTKRIDIDEKLLAQLDRLDAALADPALGETDAKPSTSVIREGAALLRLEAQLSRAFAEGK